ncbi:hypothetical protein [Hwangdonia lutea]|uniref:Uncharacterized protein n=1 Tax=Hwangdonia lutea TaxID=3075823 RepID=A0AA97EJX3_9FLAO|nr:hypothetical protein [Hwangdonia sp. SCSIO 19198]WOD42824.1 hypothetical protein RNZ46_12575 [Hwangdonia sp. SCSIO 19198]
MEGKPNFPFKTLIWAVFAILAILMFRTELKQLITNTEEFSLFGIEIKASEEKANKLNDSIQNFETTIAELSTQLTNQQNKINDLDNLKKQLQKDLENCPEAQAASMKFNAQVSKIVDANKDLKYKSDKLINTKILKSMSYNVKLIVPSNMVNADVFVDGKQANIVSKSGIFITVSVVKKNSSHRFELKDGNKRCVTNQLITKNETELPMVCNS